ncbi:branched-chain amino acid ABC transporter permease [Sphaerobacter thermophilus]|uniref:Inner-membrane translocator n=1 Tax=Sphaerobacter thermophilus (strain ATCC 49802 / DSM 20745 / KCCM 41009 / NCIMB 13125 / S 6022) TaxID=479434 RepID=D1C8H4_SPHTD|nr:branched-chain amino acid ABC transporter permease [Sphaerobacter thermophilus]ACZ40117.1 inner-membrane translocator [Sphaerobacter thermophilus DSM 20745]
MQRMGLDVRSARSRRLLVGVVAAVALLAAPAVLPDYPLSVLTEIVIFSLFVMSLNLLVGYTGLPSLGHSAFFGTGGYAVALLAIRAHLSAVPALIVAVLAGIALALVTGPFVLRTSGAYFLILTLSLTQVLFGIVWLWRGMTGGDDGLPGVPRPELPFLTGLVGSWTNFYYVVLLVVAIAVATLWWIVRSGFGLTLVGIRENERIVEGLGYPTWWTKYIVYILAGGYAALAGGLFAYFKGYVGPGQLSWLTAGEALVMVILGGAGTFWGPVLGATVVLLLRYEVSSFTQRWETILGLVFILAVLFLPEGLARLPDRIRSIRAKGRPTGAPAGQPAAEAVGSTAIAERSEQ